MNGVDNMLYMQSTNANDGTMQLTVTFGIETDVNIDQVNVQNRMAQAQPNLPDRRQPVRDQPAQVHRTSDARDFALFAKQHVTTRCSSPTTPISTSTMHSTACPASGEVRIFGASDYAMRIWVKPDVLAKLGLAVPDLAGAVRQQSTVNPSGQVGAEPAPERMEKTYTVRAQGRLQTPEEFGQIVVRSNPDGSVVRLKDVARIELGALNYQQTSRTNGQPAAIIAVFQVPGSNALAVADGVKKTMAELKGRFPADLDYVVTLDTTLPVTRRHPRDRPNADRGHDPRHPRRLPLPAELAGDAHPADCRAGVAHRHLRRLSVAGFLDQHAVAVRLVLAIGLVVDDAIVVVEAVEHHIEEGMSPREATIQAMKEVSGPVIAIALILVFGLPAGGVHGRHSGAAEQSVRRDDCGLCAHFGLQRVDPLARACRAPAAGRGKESRGLLARFYGGFNRVFAKATHGYVNWSHALIRKAVVGMLILAGFAVADGLIGRQLPTGFLPEEDYGYVFLNVQLPAAASLARTDRGVEEDRGDSRPDRGRAGTTTPLAASVC